MHKRKRLILGLGVLAILVVLFVALSYGGLLKKVIDSSSPIPSGICKDCNVVLISIDTLRADHLPCYGYEKNTAPNICALAKDSVFFKEPYSVSAWTYPSHYSMLTGLYPAKKSLLSIDDMVPFNSSTNMIQKMLRKENYSSAAFTNAGFMDRKWGFSSGFDLYNQTSSGMQARFYYNQEKISSWLEKENDKFFLFLHGYDVHTGKTHSFDKNPLNLRTMFYDNGSVSDKCYFALSRPGENISACLEIENRKGYTVSQYDGALYGSDEYIGRLISELKAKGVYDKTIIIITSDHGDRFGDHERWGHVDNLYQEEISVPLIIRIPGVEGKEVDTPVSNLDIAPTILELLGVENNYNMDGKSLLPIINGGEGRPIYSITGGKVLPRNDSLIWFSIIEDKMKLILAVSENMTGTRLYDLSADPHEKNNVQNESRYAEVYSKINSALSEWIINLNLDKSKNDSSKGLEGLGDPELIEQLRSLGYLN